MNRIIHLFFKSCNSLILFLISMLGFTTACQKDEPLVMYGSPNAGFIVKGKVESAASHQPIPDIIVEMRQVFDQEGSRLEDTGFSLPTGEYNVKLSAFPEDHTVQLKFIDTDGALNGEYESLDTTVVFEDSQYTGGDGSWYRGYVEKELNIQLKPKE